MIRHLSRFFTALPGLLVFTLIFSLGMPAVADAFMGRKAAPPNPYAITLSVENANPGLAHAVITATVTRDGVALFDRGVVFTMTDEGGTSQPGGISNTNPDGRATYMLGSGRPGVITVTATLESDPTVSATGVEVRFEMPAGFIALSEDRMNWADAKAWCEQQGGRLPLIGGSESLGRDDAGRQGTPIDGFGAVRDPWPGLPDGTYWTGTENPRHSVRGRPESWNVSPARGGVFVMGSQQITPSGVVCVP